MKTGNTLNALRNFVRGKISAWDLEEEDPLIRDVSVNRHNIGLSKVRIEFDNEESFLDLLNLSEDDIWFYSTVMSHYSDYEFLDYNMAQDEFDEGYGPWHYFDDDNKKLLNQISKTISHKPINFNSSDSIKNFARKFSVLYENERNDIASEYAVYRNEEMTNSSREKIEEELRESFYEYGLEVIPFVGFKTTVGNLISTYYQYGAENLTLFGLFEKIFNNKEIIYGHWHETSFEWSNDENFDSVGFNKGVNRILEKIVDNIESDFNSEEGKNFLEMKHRILDKYQLGKKMPLPKDKRFTFSIEGFNNDDYKISVLLQKPSGEKKLVDLTEENLTNLLYQPELFDLNDI